MKKFNRKNFNIPLTLHLKELEKKLSPNLAEIGK